MNPGKSVILWVVTVRLICLGVAITSGKNISAESEEGHERTKYEYNLNTLHL